MNVHKHARMTVHGRLLLVQRVREAGWRVVDAAAAAGVSERTAYTWLARYRAGGERALYDRSSAPARSPHRLPAATIAEIERLRHQRWTAPRIARALGRPVSTVGTALRRLGLGRVSALDAKPPAVRYERRAAGELLHIDSKKLGRIDGPGHRVTGDRRQRARGLGWEYLHVAIDDASRLAYTELLPDERGRSCAGFLARAAAWFAGLGVRIERVMTDNAFAYTHARAFQATLAELGARHLTTRPYCPRTNGKAERFIQTALRECLYGRLYTSSAERATAMPAWLHWYNHHRPHAGIHASTPASRLNNLLGNNS
jgi:transposase InsO family protein